MLIFLPLLALASAAGAAESKWSFMLHGGMIMEEKQSGVTIDEGPLFGFEVRREMSDKLSLGAGVSFATIEKESDALPGFTFEFTDMFVPLWADFKLDGLLKGLYAGPQVGLINRAYKPQNEGNIDMTSFSYGGRVGYERGLGEKLSAGLQLGYLKTGKAETTVTSDNVKVTYSVPKTSFTTLLLSLRYMF